MNDKSEAWMNGWHAHRLGVDLGENPYHAMAMEWSHNHWVDGWWSRRNAGPREIQAIDQNAGF